MAFKRSGNSPQEGHEKDSGIQERLFIESFEEYADALFRHASIRLSDRERAIEVVHDAFTKAWGYIREGHEIASFRSFLYKVLNNLIIDEYRRRKETSLDAILAIEGVDEGMFPELRDESSETLAQVFDAQQAFALVGSLPEIYRESIIFRFVDGLTPKEIAELIEENVSVVSVRIHRGLKLLRQQIERERKGL